MLYGVACMQQLIIFKDIAIDSVFPSGILDDSEPLLTCVVVVVLYGSIARFFGPYQAALHIKVEFEAVVALHLAYSVVFEGLVSGARYLIGASAAFAILELSKREVLKQPLKSIL